MSRGLGDVYKRQYIAKVMYDNIPNSRWELFRECRHMCFVEDNDHYVEVLKEWLNEKD